LKWDKSFAINLLSNEICMTLYFWNVTCESPVSIAVGENEDIYFSS
jgi:hypothetical protein